MALTRDTTAPITPTAMTGAGSASKTGTTIPFICLANETFRVGDVVIINAGRADAADTAQTDDRILGVAVQAKTAGATTASSDTVLIACALPGESFSGSMTAGAATDHTPSATPATEAAFLAATVDTVLGTDAYTGYLLVNGADTTDGQLAVYRFSDQQLRGQKFVLGVQTPLNPRVDFVFRNSFFSQFTA